MHETPTVTFPISPEVAILICCARKTLREKDQAQIRELLSRVLAQDAWNRLLDLADEHGLIPLLHHHLCALLRETGGADAAIAREPMRELECRARTPALRALSQCAALLRILESFARRGIPAVTYKGPALAARAYGNAVLRQSADLDFVVPQEFMPAVCEEMKTLEFSPRFSAGQIAARAGRNIPGEYAFAHARDGILAEVHTEITLRHFLSPPPLGEMLARAESLPLNGREASVFAAPVFSKEDLLLILAVHGAKDFWARLIWVADIAELARSLADESWRVVLERARKWRLGRMLRVALALAHTIFEEPLKEPVLQSIERDRVAAKMAREIRGELLGLAAARDGIIARSRYRIRMAENVAEGVRYWMRLSTTPAQDDWQPDESSKKKPAHAYFTRPLRLWRRYRS